MTIKVLYFASLREDIGRAIDNFDYPNDSASALNVEQLWYQATGREHFPEELLVAVNQEYKDAYTVLNDGDEVAFFPPVTGG